MDAKIVLLPVKKQECAAEKRLEGVDPVFGILNPHGVAAEGLDSRYEHEPGHEDTKGQDMGGDG